MGVSPAYERHERAARDADMVQTLTGMNASAEIRLAYKTRRLVHGAMLNISERKSQSKRSLALVMTAIAVVLVVFAPVIWNVVDHLVGEEHVGDISTQMALLLLFALPALLAALLLMGRTLQDVHRGNRHS
jgi:ABC-type transport system involved in cytochrome bd biosynthesis fused ATPase/permease subunit